MTLKTCHPSVIFGYRVCNTGLAQPFKEFALLEIQTTDLINFFRRGYFNKIMNHLLRAIQQTKVVKVGEPE